MFAELMPLLADRTVVLTLAKTGDTQIAVNVIPKRSGDKDENTWIRREPSDFLPEAAAA